MEGWGSWGGVEGGKEPTAAQTQMRGRASHYSGRMRSRGTTRRRSGRRRRS